MSNRVELNAKKVRELEHNYVERQKEFREEVEAALNFPKLKDNIRDSLVNPHGVDLENGILYTFRVFVNEELTVYDELRLFCYYPESVISIDEKRRMSNQALQAGKAEPLIKYLPSAPVTMRFLENIHIVEDEDGKLPRPNNAVLRVDNFESVYSHPFFTKHF